MKLFMFPVAPNPTKVRLYLDEKAAAGCAIEIEQVVVNLLEGAQKEPEHLARNPFGTLPVLELDDGSFLFESLSIIEYLEELFPEPSLYGTTAEQRAYGRQLERIADLGVLYSIARIVHATRSPLGLPAKPEVAEFFHEQLHHRLDFFERLLADGRPFAAGESVTVADCTLAAGFQFGRARDFHFLADHPNLAAWDAGFRERPSATSILVA